MSFERLKKPPTSDELAFNRPLDATCDYHVDIIGAAAYWVQESDAEDVGHAQIAGAISNGLITHILQERNYLASNRRIPDEVSGTLFNMFSLGELLRQPFMELPEGGITIGEDEILTGSVPQAKPFLLDVPASKPARLHLSRDEVEERIPDLPLPKRGQRPAWSKVEGTGLFLEVKGPADITAALAGSPALERFPLGSMVSLVPHIQARTTGQNHQLHCKPRGYPVFLDELK